MLYWVLALAWCGTGIPAWGDPILDPGAPNGLVLYRLGPVSLPQNVNPAFLNYGGIVFNGGNLLLSASDSTLGNQNIFSLPVIRGGGTHITGFDTATTFAAVPTDTALHSTGNVVGGGMAVYNGTLLYNTDDIPFLGQSAGSQSSLTPVSLLPVSGPHNPDTLGGLAQIGNTNTFKMSSADGNWYTVTLTPGSNGIYRISQFTQAAIGIPADSFAYIPADGVLSAGMVVGDTGLSGEGNANVLQLYGLDGNGNPVGTPYYRLVDGNDTFIAFGIARDPVTGDILFTTSNNQIWLLSDTIPEPASLGLVMAGMALLAWRFRRA